MSHYEYSSKAIVLISNSRYDLAIKGALSSVGLTPVTDIPNLSSLSTIGRVLKTTRNTAFIRGELYKFIQEKGFPYFVILDMRLNVGLDRNDDPDNMKIFRAFLISYLIFSMGRGFDKLHLNLLLLYDDSDAEVADLLFAQPERILSALHTRNEKVNELIERMKKNPAEFYKICTLKFLPKSKIHSKIDDELITYKQLVETKKSLRDKAVKKQASSVSNDDREPADVYFLAAGHLYINGEPSDSFDNTIPLENGDIQVQGHWTGRTSKDVAGRVKKSIVQAIRDRNFKQSDPLNIHLSEKCIIDGTVASVLAGIVITDLASLQQKKIMVSRFNQTTLAESQGFNMIKEYLVYRS